jgi:AraC-like DNA-binding protein
LHTIRLSGHPAPGEPLPSIGERLVGWSDWVLALSAERSRCGLAKGVFRSADVDETRLAIAQVFAEHQLDLVDRSSRLDATFAAWDLGEVAIAYVRHGADVIVRPGRLGSYYGLNVAVKGSATLRSGRSEAELRQASAVVMSPTDEIVMRRSADCEEVALRVDRCAVERELSRMLRRDVDAPLVFVPAMDLAKPAGRTWAATLGYVLDEIRQNTGSLGHPLVRSRVEQLIIDQLLLTQPNNYSGELETGYRPARPPAVRRALEIIDARAAEPLTVPMLAELVGVSVRGLRQGFRDYLGTTPLEYLREVRLARARDDLLATEPEDGTSVTEIAYRWGFGHLARFAGYYKQRYGELPSETLRRP